mgnify:CR=1 FL=1
MIEKWRRAWEAGRIDEYIEYYADDATQHAQDMACNTLQSLRWADIDVASLVAQAADLRQRIAAELAARPDLAVLDAQIQQQDQAQRAAAEARLQADVRARGLDAEITRLDARLQAQAAVLDGTSATTT